MSFLPTTRAEAKASGLKFYHGVTCKRGHTLRYVSNGVCVQCTIGREHEKTKGHALRGIEVTREGNQLTITVPQGLSITINHTGEGNQK